MNNCNFIQKSKILIKLSIALYFIMRSKKFDKSFYLKFYKDIKPTFLSPYLHYLRYGWKEGRKPNRFYNNNFYGETCPLIFDYLNND